MAVTTGAGAISLKSQGEERAAKFYARGKEKTSVGGPRDGGTDYRRRAGSLSSTPRALRPYNCHFLPSDADGPTRAPKSPPKKKKNCPDELVIVREPFEVVVAHSPSTATSGCL